VHILVITSEWPTEQHPEWAPFIIQQVQALRRAGVQVDVMPFRGAKNPMRYMQAYYRARRYLRCTCYDLIHAHFGQSGLLALPKPIPLVVTFHGSDLQGIVGPKGQYTFQGHILRFLSKRIASLANEIIVVSESLAKHLPQQLSYHIIPGGIDLNLFKPSSKEEARNVLNLPHDRSLILFGGRPDVARKRYSLAQQAIKQLDDRHHAALVVLRDIPHHVVPTYMNACDVLLLTSLHEGSPTVVKEALACNLPVVSVNVGDVQERLARVPGCVVCSDDLPQTIAVRLTEVLSQTVPFHSRHAVEDLNEDMVAKRIIEVYHHALSQRGNEVRLGL
jgi:teichuronic acid biosynthesis glycosyltransferase TuaC